MLQEKLPNVNICWNSVKPIITKFHKVLNWTLPVRNDAIQFKLMYLEREDLTMGGTTHWATLPRGIGSEWIGDSLTCSTNNVWARASRSIITLIGLVLRARIVCLACTFVRSGVLPPRRTRGEMRAHIFTNASPEQQSILRSLSEAIELVERTDTSHSNNTTLVCARYTAIASRDSN